MLLTRSLALRERATAEVDRSREAVRRARQLKWQVKILLGSVRSRKHQEPSAPPPAERKS